MFRPLEAIIRSRFGYPSGYPNLDLMMASRGRNMSSIRRFLTGCNKLFSNSCLVFNLNYYKFVVLDVHTLLFQYNYKHNGDDPPK